MERELVELSNTKGTRYAIPLPFIGKETRVGDKVVSYQLLRLQRTGFFTIEELYTIACLIQERDPKSLIDWTATFMLLENDTNSHIRKRLMAMHLA
ncbi:MAG: hypothetical protein V4557_12170 [Bacteroidota bacterium]